MFPKQEQVMAKSFCSEHGEDVMSECHEDDCTGNDCSLCGGTGWYCEECAIDYMCQ
jgi:hypothetical protein